MLCLYCVITLIMKYKVWKWTDKFIAQSGIPIVSSHSEPKTEEQLIKDRIVFYNKNLFIIKKKYRLIFIWSVIAIFFLILIIGILITLFIIYK
jgi:hypothetical protein